MDNSTRPFKKIVRLITALERAVEVRGETIRRCEDAAFIYDADTSKLEAEVRESADKVMRARHALMDAIAKLEAPTNG